MWNQVGGTLSNSMAQAIQRFASLLPGILAFLLAVVLFSLIGWLLAWAVRRILIRCTSMKSWVEAPMR